MSLRARTTHSELADSCFMLKAMDSYQRAATLSPNGLLNAHRAQSSNNRSGTASPPIHVSPVTSVRLRDLAARLQQTVNDQRRYRATTTTNDVEPGRTEERKMEDGEEADYDADLTTRTGLSTSHACSLSTRHLPGGNLKDLEKLARGLLDENGDKIVSRRHQTFPHRPGR